ncbi:MAG: DUF6134 family protein [Azospirillaceae bacterium]
MSMRTSLHRPSVPKTGRRPVLAGLGAAALGAALPFGLSRSATASVPMNGIPPAGLIPFDIRRGDSVIGAHTLRFSGDASRLTVDIAIDIEVKAAFITVYRYTHRNTETWADGRLQAIQTRTDDNGDTLSVSGRATADGFRVEGSQGTVAAPADILPTSYWNIGTVEATRLLDTQKGTIREVSIAPAGRETVTAAGRQVQATRYAVTGDLTLDVWYSDPGQWVKMYFQARGATIDYTLNPGEAGASTLVERA